MLKKVIISIFALIPLSILAVYIIKQNTGIENPPKDLCCADGSMIVRSSPETYYTIPNESYINQTIKGTVGEFRKKRISDFCSRRRAIVCS